MFDGGPAENKRVEQIKQNKEKKGMINCKNQKGDETFRAETNISVSNNHQVILKTENKVLLTYWPRPNRLGNRNYFQ